MAVRFQIPRVLQPYFDDLPELTLHGSTLRALLEDLQRGYPQLYRCICNETGAVRRHIHVFVNDVLSRGPDELDAPLKADDVVAVFQAVSVG